MWLNKSGKYVIVFFKFVMKQREEFSYVQTKFEFLLALLVTGNVELAHSMDQSHGNFVAVAVLVVEQVLYHFVLAVQPI